MQPLPTKNDALRSNKNDQLNVADHAVVIVAAIADLVVMGLQVDPDRLVVPIPVHNVLAAPPVVALDNPPGLHTAAVMDQADMVEVDMVEVDMVEVKADDPADQNAVVVAADETVMVREVAVADAVVMKAVDQLSQWLLPVKSL